MHGCYVICFSIATVLVKSRCLLSSVLHYIKARVQADIAHCLRMCLVHFQDSIVNPTEKRLISSSIVQLV